MGSSKSQIDMRGHQQNIRKTLRNYVREQFKLKFHNTLDIYKQRASTVNHKEYSNMRQQYCHESGKNEEEANSDHMVNRESCFELRWRLFDHHFRKITHTLNNKEKKDDYNYKVINKFSLKRCKGTQFIYLPVKWICSWILLQRYTLILRNQIASIIMYLRFLAISMAIEISNERIYLQMCQLNYPFDILFGSSIRVVFNLQLLCISCEQNIHCSYPKILLLNNGIKFVLVRRINN
jgi:hypothetical protein